MKLVIFTIIWLCLQSVLAIGKSPFLRGKSKIYSKLDRMPYEVKEYLKFHEEFLRHSGKNDDYCQFDITGRGYKTDDHELVLKELGGDFLWQFERDRMIRGLKEVFRPGIWERLHPNKETWAWMLKRLTYSPPKRVSTLDHRMVHPVNGTNKFLFMALDDNWMSAPDCMDACIPCAEMATRFKSHWMICHRVTGTGKPFNKPACTVAYGRNPITPGRNETDWYAC